MRLDELDLVGDKNPLPKVEGEVQIMDSWMADLDKERMERSPDHLKE
jgi:hypothetical protein